MIFNDGVENMCSYVLLAAVYLEEPIALGMDNGL